MTHAALGAAEPRGAHARSFHEDHHDLTPAQQAFGGLHGLLVGLTATHGKGTQRVERPTPQFALEQLLLGNEVHRATNTGTDYEGVEEAAVVAS
jgi:hypothetical protein